MNDTPSTPESSDEAAAVQQWADKFNNLRDELRKVIVGQDDVIEQILIAMVARGHALLEGVPGLQRRSWCIHCNRCYPFIAFSLRLTLAIGYHRYGCAAEDL